MGLSHLLLVNFLAKTADFYELGSFGVQTIQSRFKRSTYVE